MCLTLEALVRNQSSTLTDHLTAGLRERVNGGERWRVKKRMQSLSKSCAECVCIKDLDTRFLENQTQHYTIKIVFHRLRLIQIHKKQETKT